MCTILSYSMPSYPIRNYNCPRCGREYQDLERAHFVGKPCKQCTQLMMNMRSLQEKLIDEEVSIDQTDEALAKQIKDLLESEVSGFSAKSEDLLGALMQRLLADEERRKNIIKEMQKLQEEKK